VVLITVSDEGARKLLAEKGAPVGSYAENAKRPEVQAAVKAAIDAVNAEMPPYATLKRFSVLDADFSQETGELTPKLSVKRKVCNAKYKAQIDGMYAGTAVVD
jgi:long-chain acyl-CoA synthetase